MARTDAELVKGVLGDHYGTRRDGTQPELGPFIDIASAVVSRAVSKAAAKGDPFSDVEAELIERLMAAHFYTLSDPLYKSRRTQSAAGEFMQRRYDEEAMRLDHGGALASALSRPAGGVWLGTPAGQQTTWHERNC